LGFGVQVQGWFQTHLPGHEPHQAWPQPVCVCGGGGGRHVALRKGFNPRLTIQLIVGEPLALLPCPHFLVSRPIRLHTLCACMRCFQYSSLSGAGKYPDAQCANGWYTASTQTLQAAVWGASIRFIGLEAAETTGFNCNSQCSGVLTSCQQIPTHPLGPDMGPLTLSRPASALLLISSPACCTAPFTSPATPMASSATCSGSAPCAVVGWGGQGREGKEGGGSRSAAVENAIRMLRVHQRIFLPRPWSPQQPAQAQRPMCV
jgi:hypothetical protein